MKQDVKLFCRVEELFNKTALITTLIYLLQIKTMSLMNALLNCYYYNWLLIEIAFMFIDDFNTLSRQGS